MGDCSLRTERAADATQGRNAEGTESGTSQAYGEISREHKRAAINRSSLHRQPDGGSFFSGSLEKNTDGASQILISFTFRDDLSRHPVEASDRAAPSTQQVHDDSHQDNNQQQLNQTARDVQAKTQEL